MQIAGVPQKNCVRASSAVYNSANRIALQAQATVNAVTALDPLISEFDTQEQEDAHTAWIRAELERRKRIPQGKTPHDEVMRRMRERIAAWERKQMTETV